MVTPFPPLEMPPLVLGAKGKKRWKSSPNCSRAPLRNPKNFGGKPRFPPLGFSPGEFPGGSKDPPRAPPREKAPGIPLTRVWAPSLCPLNHPGLAPKSPKTFSPRGKRWFPLAKGLAPKACGEFFSPSNKLTGRSKVSFWPGFPKRALPPWGPPKLPRFPLPDPGRIGPLGEIIIGPPCPGPNFRARSLQWGQGKLTAQGPNAVQGLGKPFCPAFHCPGAPAQNCPIAATHGGLVPYPGNGNASWPGYLLAPSCLVFPAPLPWRQVSP